jgi:hypothetical protein
MQGSSPMAYEVPRSLVEAFYKVYATRNADRIAEYLDDEIEWTISGPVDYLAFCGTHRGKAVVVDMIKRQVPQVAMLSRQSSRRTADNRAVSFRVANFMRFLDGKVVENISLIDSFDAVEQVLGRPLAVHDAPGMGDDDIVTV